MHQRGGVDDAAGQQRRKLRLGPAQQLHGRRADQQLGGRLGPQDLVDHVVGPVGRIGDAVAVHVEGRMVAPVVAAPAGAPVELAAADIFNLGPVADEGIAFKGVVRGPGREMDAYGAALEPVAAYLVLVGVVHEEAVLAAAFHLVAADLGLVCIVQHQAVIAVADGDIAAHLQPVGEHQRVTDVVADRDVPFDDTVVAVHVVDRKAQVLEVVATEGVL